MPQYHWKGIDAQGTRHKGTIACKSQDHLRSHLLQKKIALLSFQEKSTKKTFFKTKQTEIINFFSHLSILLESNVPLLQALKLTKNYTRSKQLQGEIENIMEKISCGEKFSDALTNKNPFFSPLMIQAVKSGEQANRLHESCKSLAAHLEKKHALIKKLQQAALLPTITLLFSLTIIISLFLFVVPQFQPMLLERADVLPTSTKLLFAVSNTLQSEHYKIIIMLGLVGVLVLIRLLRKRTKNIFPRFWLSHLTQFAQTLSFLLKSGVPLSHALELLGKNEIKKYVDAGQPLAQACRSAGFARRHESFLAAIDVGEQTGKLEQMLETSGRLLESQLNARIQTLVTMTQPVLLVITGLIITFLLLSIYLPLFNFS